MIVCAGKSETFDFATPIGIGLIESAINLTRICLFDRPDYILFIGSAGSYGKYKPFDIVESCKAVQVEVSSLLDYTYTPLLEIMQKNVSCETICFCPTKSSIVFGLKIFDNVSIK